MLTFMDAKLNGFTVSKLKTHKIPGELPWQRENWKTPMFCAIT